MQKVARQSIEKICSGRVQGRNEAFGGVPWLVDNEPQRMENVAARAYALSLRGC